MINCLTAQEHRDAAEALAAFDRTITVELSVPAAWVLRDLIGTHQIDKQMGVSMHEDVLRLNAQLDVRPQLSTPHVAHWSQRMLRRWMVR